MLATGTKARGASCHNATHDVGFATRKAPLAGTVVHPMLGLEPPGLAIDSHVLGVVQRAAALVHCITQYEMNRRDETFARWCVQA